MTFKIGMKVTLISDRKFRNLLRGERAPVFGEVYTIRGMEFCEGYLGLIFDEIRNPELYLTGIRECLFKAYRFRPVVSPKQQVSFTTGAPRDSRKWDNRRKRVEVVS